MITKQELRKINHVNGRIFKKQKDCSYNGNGYLSTLRFSTSILK